MNPQNPRCKACQDRGYIYTPFGFSVACGNCSGGVRSAISAGPPRAVIEANPTPDHASMTPLQVERLLKIAFGIGVAVAIWLLYRCSNPTAANNGAMGGLTDSPPSVVDFSNWEPEV